MTNRFDDGVRSAFDAWAPTYLAEASAKIADRGYSYRELGEAIATVARPTTGPVLEVGVGPGILGVEVLRAGAGIDLHGIDLHGIDISPAMLALAQATGAYSRLDLAAADSYAYDRTYSTIYSAFAFHSVRDQPEFLERARTALRSDGVLIIVDLFPAAPLSPADGAEHSRKFEKGAPSNYMDTDAFREIATNAGFSVVDERQLGEARDFNHAWFALHG